MLNAKQAGGGDSGSRVIQKNLDPGNYPGRLVQLIDFGLQPQRPFKGEEKAPLHEIGLTYELVDTFMLDEEGNEQLDKPRWISEQIPLHNLKADRAKSTQRYNALDPQGVHDGEFPALLETPCTITIVNNPGKDGKVYDNVGAIAPMRPRDAANCPPLVNKSAFFDLDDPDMEVFGKFPKWIQDKIKGNLNYEGSPLQKRIGGEAAPKKEDAPKKPAKAPQKPVKEEDEGAPFDVEDDDNNNHPY